MAEKSAVNKDTLKYQQLDGLRAYSAIGIALMHVKANAGYQISGFISEKFINYMGDLVFLFMLISAFSMCCGYYVKIKNQEISLNQFYSRRFSRIFPFFAILCLIDIIVSPSSEAMYELFANLTLCFGLLPNAHIEVIGVGWFIGLVFVFYMLFPFYVYLISNKLRMWSTFIIAFIFNILCSNYFFDNNHVVSTFDARANIIFCAVYFLAGGLIFIYKDTLETFARKYNIYLLITCFIIAGIYFEFEDSVYTLLPLSAILLIYALRRDVKRNLLQNKFTRFISDISMEIYLCHMVIYRGLEKLNLVHMFKNDVISYIITAILVLIGAVIFSLIMKVIITRIEIYLKDIINKRIKIG